MGAVHITEVKSFLRCRLLHYWTSRGGLYLEPDLPREPLFLGRVVHSALEEYYDKGVNPAAVVSALGLQELERSRHDTSKLEEALRLGTVMLRGYVRWAEPRDAKLKWLATETSWEVPLPRTQMRLAGRFDGVVEDEEGNLWVMEFKTTSSALVEWTRQDLQATAYAYAARRLYDRPVKGVLFRFLRKKEPKTWEQLLLKDGTPTARESLPRETTYHEYYIALGVATLAHMLEIPHEEAHRLLQPSSHRSTEPWWEDFQKAFLLTRRAYRDQLMDVRDRNEFFWEVPEPRTPQEVDRYMRYVVVPAAHEIGNPNHWVGPTGLGAGFLCRSCGFRLPCQLAMEGADYESILGVDFRRRETCDAPTADAG